MEESISPQSGSVPSHIAMVMDGNGRWASQRGLPRFVGHRKGLKALERVVQACVELDISYLTVFAFSTENWRRPPLEVNFLMNLFSKSLEEKIQQLHKNNIRFRFIGNTARLGKEIVSKINKAEALTLGNKRFMLTVAVDYGGRWDIVNAVNHLIKGGCKEVTEENIKPFLALADLPEPQLYIRTAGELRLSNFLLWQMAYTEFYFTDTLWPDFGKKELVEAIASFQQRERRFGRVSEQLPLAERRD
ncbi:MAG: polyprenyl diphosphate synthase [Neisseriaceae bacterium]